MTSYIHIYTPDGARRGLYPVTRDSEISCTLMGDTFIKVVFNHPVIIDFKAGSFISHNQRKWSLLNNYKPESLASGNGYKYELKFYAEQHQLQRCIFFWKQGDTREASFNLTTRLQDYAQLICDNINYYLAITSYSRFTTWAVGNIPTGLSEKCIYQAFDGVSCWDALTNIANAFEVEWWVEDDFDSSTATLHFGRCENGDAVEFAEGGIVSKMPASKRGEDANYGTRFYVYGGTQNIPDDYYTSQDGGVTNHVSAKRLHIPSTYPTPYIDSKDNLKSNEVIEKVVILDDIFPNNTETIDEVTTRTETKDGVETTYFRIRCENSTFNPSTDRLSESLGAKFLTGSLQGREYDLIPDANFAGINGTRTFEIVARNEGTGDTSIITPNQYLKPKAGDTFVLTGVKLSSQRIYDAEEQLFIAGQAIAYKHSADREVYECPTDPVYCSQNNHNFQLGQRVTLVGAAFGDGRISRIQGYTKKLWNEYEATYSVGDNARYTRFGAISVIASNIKTDTIKQFQSLQNSTYRVSTELRIATNSTGPIGNLERKVGILIGDDHDMSAREIAEDVVASSGGGGGGGSEFNEALQLHINGVDHYYDGSVKKSISLFAPQFAPQRSGQIAVGVNATRVEWSDIKTINGISILGTGNIQTLENLTIETIEEDIPKSYILKADTIFVFTKEQTQGSVFMVRKRDLNDENEHKWGVRFKVADNNTGSYSVSSDGFSISWKDGRVFTTQNGGYYDVLLHYKDGVLYGEYSAYGDITMPTDAYIADFTLRDMASTADKSIDFSALYDAMRKGKIILVNSVSSSYMVASTRYIMGIGRDPSTIYVSVYDGTKLYEATASNSTNTIKGGAASTIATTDYVDNNKNDVYILEEPLEFLFSGQYQVDFASLLDAIWSDKIIRARLENGGKLFTALAYEAKADEWIILQITNINTAYSIRIERDDTNQDKGNVTTVMTKELAFTDYVDSVVGDINTLLETIIAG